MKVPAPYFTDVVNRAHVGMIEHRRGFCLALKTAERLVIAGHPYGQVENLNDASRVWKLKFPLVGMYWLTYQKVQSSEGSMTISV